jgi:hypothetical protein
MFHAPLWQGMFYECPTHISVLRVMASLFFDRLDLQGGALHNYGNGSSFNSTPDREG